MKKHKKISGKMVSLALAVIMAIGIIPISVSAATLRTTTLRLNNYGEAYYDGGAWSAPVDNVSTYTVAGSTDEGWIWTYDINSQKYTLKLENTKIEVANGSAIQFPVPKADIKIDIVVSGDNTVSGGGNETYDQALSGIYVPINTMNPFSSDVTIKGKGSLSVSSNPNKPITHNYGKAINLDKGSLVISDVDVTAIGPIHAYTDISITNSNVTVEGFNSNSPLHCYGNMSIEDSKIVSTVNNQLNSSSDDNSRAIHAGKAMTIKNSDVTATGGAYGVNAAENLVIEKSKISANGHTWYGVNGKSVSVKESTIDAIGKRCAISASNGVIDMQESKITAEAQIIAALYATQYNNTNPAIILGDRSALELAGKIGTTETPDSYGYTTTSFIVMSDDYLQKNNLNVPTNTLKKVTINVTADYSDVDKVIAEAKALNKNKYKDFSAVETAITAVVRGKLASEQSVVDGYAAAIKKAIGELVRINRAVSANKIYDGTATVVVSEVFFNDVFDTDEVSADAVGTLASPNAGTYTVVNLTNIVLKGKDAEWYEAPETMSNLITDVTISKVNPEITLNTQPGSYVQGGGEIEVTATINNHFDYFDGLPTANQIVLTADNAKLKPGTSIVKNENTYTAVFVADDKIDNSINFSANVSKDAVNYSALASSVTKSVSIVGPADYSALNTVLNNIPDDLNLYTNETLQVLNDAVDSIQWNLLLPEQTIVDGYSAAIENAISALQYKDADYSKVDVALSKIPSDLSVYTDESAKAVNDAKNAVVLGKNITEQATVDGYATAIEDAVNGLKKKTETIKPGSDVKDETQDGSGKTTSNNPQKPDKNVPSTGDNTSIGFYFITLFLSASTLLVITKKRKKIN